MGVLSTIRIIKGSTFIPAYVRSNMGSRIDLHTHTIHSDGMTLPSELARYAGVKGHSFLAMTDHVDSSNVDEIVTSLVRFQVIEGASFGLQVVPGVEITHVQPVNIEQVALRARLMGARIVLVHGETPTEPVKPGTNLAAVSKRGVIDVLAHPGNNLSMEAGRLAKRNDVFLEITAKEGHNKGNVHVAKVARKTGAKLVVNTDSHNPDEHLMTMDEAYLIALTAGLSQREAKKAIIDNPRQLLIRLGYKV